MKIIVLCVCVLGFALSDLVGNKTIRQSAEEAEGALREKLETCMTENNVTFDAWSEAVQILINVHKKPENVEKSRKLGCILACYLKKQDLPAILTKDFKMDDKLASDLTKLLQHLPD
ncbi:hypothetical protein EAG_03209 [Camponotus floridanus]|uniref:Uncharacterized protein n=1 Tax=Camponotus floridanus TaxID=104421 RepID=E2B244_CAMFO|nr:hypothetical protein EAG_03209 [Camponotus floridanus]